MNAGPLVTQLPSDPRCSCGRAFGADGECRPCRLDELEFWSDYSTRANVVLRRDIELLAQDMLDRQRERTYFLALGEQVDGFDIGGEG